MTSATATMKPQKFSIHDILTRSPPTVQTYTTDTTVTDQRHDESSTHNITSLPTPPQSPETDDNVKKANNGDETNNIQAEHNDTRGLKRKRDPIGQILDSLCSKAEKKSSTEPSAFSPIITSSSSPQLSPLSMLSQCERRSVQTSPHGLSVHPQSHPPTQQLSVHTHPQTQNVTTKCANKDQLHVEHLRIIEAQKMAHIQQMYHQQQQQQHARLHQQRNQLQSQVPGLHSRQLPYFVPTSAPHNIQQLQLMQERHAHLMALEAQNANMLMNTSHVGNMVSPPRLTGPQPAWLSWLKTTNAAMDQMTSLPLKETRIPPPPRYQCDACKKSYSTFGGLSKHKQFHCVSHVKKEFNCKYCEKSYGSLGALKMHIRTHTLPCKCKLCGKAFSRPWLLQGHLRTHTGEKPFSCAHCGRAFADRSNLRAHLQTHSDIKKYACKNCTKTFSRMSLLLKHEEGSCIGLRR